MGGVYCNSSHWLRHAFTVALVQVRYRTPLLVLNCWIRGCQIVLTRQSGSYIISLRPSFATLLLLRRPLQAVVQLSTVSALARIAVLTIASRVALTRVVTGNLVHCGLTRTDVIKRTAVWDIIANSLCRRIRNNVRRFQTNSCTSEMLGSFVIRAGEDVTRKG